jgi:heat shock protein HslJ
MVDLAGTWRFTALEGAQVEGPRRATPWLTFDGDGQVFGMAGVNRVRGTWELDGDSLTFGPVVSTLMAGPPDAMECEQRVFQLLDGTVTVSSPADDTVTLAGTGSATLVRDPTAGDKPV